MRRYCLITDGGGNDLMGSCGATATPDCAAIKSALATVQLYFDEMKNSAPKKSSGCATRIRTDPIGPP